MNIFDNYDAVQGNDGGGNNSMAPTTKTTGWCFTFPVKLHLLLTEAEEPTNAYLASIVSWNDDGTSFKVHDPDKFVKSIADERFKQTRYKSFQRQLNLYGFNRIIRGHLKGSCKLLLSLSIVCGRRGGCQHALNPFLFLCFPFPKTLYRLP